MICKNCKTELSPNEQICKKCGTMVQETIIIPNNTVIEQPVVNQVIEEEHKDKKNKKNKKKILTTISILFFGLSLATIIIANVLPKESREPKTITIPTIKPVEPTKTNSFNYNGYNVAYLSDYEVSTENNLLILESKYLSFQMTLHPNVSQELFEQNKEELKNTLINNGYIIRSEENTIRSGIDFYLIKMYNMLDNQEENFEYYLTVENNTLFEILVYENKKRDDNYSKISNQLRTIVTETKKAN